jgi:hypothetical protein
VAHGDESMIGDGGNDGDVRRRGADMAVPQTVWWTLEPFRTVYRYSGH